LDGSPSHGSCYVMSCRNALIIRRRCDTMDEDELDELDNEGQPSWEQEWEDFGEVYDDEPTYI